MAKGKFVGTDWTWFTDYVYWSSWWTLNAESGTKLEVGIGIKFAGKPRGGIRKFQDFIEFETYGIGAIHVRAVAGIGPCWVELRQGEAGAVPVYGDPSVLRGAIHDGKIIYDKVKDAL